MKILLSSLICFGLSLPALAFENGDMLPSFKIENQFGDSVELQDSTVQILFAADKPASKLLTEFMNAQAGSLDLSEVIIVSDISKMPALISRMIAIPKMKNYAFKMALDKSGETTKSWPRQEGQLTLITVSNKAVTQVEFLGSTEDLQKKYLNN